MRPTLLIDVDGVLADFIQAALGHVREITGITYDHSTVRTWEVFDSLPSVPLDVPEMVYARMKAPGGCRSIPIIPHAQEGLAPIAEVADIVAVTAPFKGSPTWVHEREEWLQEHFPYIKAYVHTHDKKRVRGDIFIDDNHSNVESWVQYWEDFFPIIGVHWHLDRNDLPERWSGLLTTIKTLL